VSWIVTNWRLKLLALVLSLGLLGAVAFSENPLTLSSARVKINYAGSGLPSDLVLVNPPPSVAVPVLGVKDAVANLVAGSIVVTPNLAHLKVGSNTVSVSPKVLVPGVTLQSDTLQLSLTVEHLMTARFAVDIRIPNLSAGVSVDTEHTFAVCGDTLTACQVQVTAPASFLKGLDAYVLYTNSIGPNATVDSNNYPVHFEQNGRPLDFSSLANYPLPTVNHANVGVHIRTLGGTESSPVPLRVSTTGSLACGYQLAAVVIQPTPIVQVTGPAKQVSALTVITLAPVDLTGLSSGTTVTRAVSTGDPALKADPTSVKIAVTVSQAFTCQPAASPSPAPGATAPGG